MLLSHLHICFGTATSSRQHTNKNMPHKSRCTDFKFGPRSGCAENFIHGTHLCFLEFRVPQFELEIYGAKIGRNCAFYACEKVGHILLAKTATRCVCLLSVRMVLEISLNFLEICNDFLEIS